MDRPCIYPGVHVGDLRDALLPAAHDRRDLFRLYRRVEHQEQERGQLQQYCRVYDLRHGARKRL